MNHTPSRTAVRLAGLAGAFVLALSATSAPASAVTPRTDRGTPCVAGAGESSAARGGWNGHDTRALTDRQIARIEARTQRLLAAKAQADGKGNGGGKGKPGGGGGGGNGGGDGGTGSNAISDIPVYVHVMMDSAGNGNVSDQQIHDQIDVLNLTYSGQDADAAAADVVAGTDTAARFSLAGVDRWNNNAWHRDNQSTTYRARTRLGGKNALNIWLVDFRYLGIATFPWDYAANPDIDGIRVQYDSLPGGGIANYNQGETATHETGHWLGLFHTFQGGCTSPGDWVDDTAAQASASSGCPTGRDSCTDSPGSDPIHNYMDYSYDSCYWEFTPDQAARMQTQFDLYRS